MTTAFEDGAALCLPFLRALPVAGLSISVVSAAGAQSTIGTSDLIAARLEELQFQLGEGPSPDAIRSGQPALAPDLLAAEPGRLWPIFTDAALETGARGLFSFPLLTGSVAVGVVSLYALVLGPDWSSAVLASATELVGATVLPAVELATRAAGEERVGDERRQTELRREVHQAAGMVMVQLGTTIEDALARLRAHAFAVERPIDLIAKDVVAGALDFRTIDD